MLHTVYGKKIKIELTDNLGGDGESDAIELSYFDEEKWQFLHKKNFFLINGDLSTKDKTDAFYSEVLAEFNKVLFEKFGKALGDEPENGIERLKWLLSRTIVDNNTIKLK